MQCDYWSIGVVAFVVLSGTMPFYEEDAVEMLQKIRTCEWSFESPTWQNVSMEGRNFVSGLMVAEPEKRLNFEQMMDHPWMKLDLDGNDMLEIDKTHLSQRQLVKSQKS